jgi:tight adherence protein B
MSLPFGIIGFISLTNPDYLAGFTESAIGYGMLAVGAVMMTLGGFWLKNTVKIRF